MRVYKRIFPYLSIFVATFWVSTLFLNGGLSLMSGAKLSDVMEDNGEKPFAYRLLIPKAIKLMSLYTPEVVKKRIHRYVDNHPERFQGFYQELRWEKGYFIEYLYAYLICFLLFFFSWIILWKLLIDLYNLNMATALLLVAWGCLILPLYFRYSSFIYDPGVLFFSSLLMFLVYHRQDLLLFLVFPLAVLNKESALFLVPFFFFRRRFFLGVCYLLLCWFVIKACLFWNFLDYSGNTLSFQLYRNIEITLYHKLRFSYVIVFFICWGLLIFEDLGRKPSWIVKGVCVSFPAMFILGYIWGWIDEVRIFLDLFPAFFLLASQTFTGWLINRHDTRHSIMLRLSNSQMPLRE